jgi:aconitate hydratase
MAKAPAHAFASTLKTFKTASGKSGKYWSLKELAKQYPTIERLPVSIRIVLESVLRNCDGQKVSPKHVEELAHWAPNAERTDEIPFVVTRVVLQDFTGVPLLADLAAMRSVAAKLGKSPKTIEPLVPVDLVVDHSVMVDYYGTPKALDLNMKLEFQRNNERYQFMKWGMQAFDTFRVTPPGFGIVHQVNLEYFARGVYKSPNDKADTPTYYPDSLVGTDSHTTMINGIGVVGWGVGGIEAEAAMLGQPVYMLTPDVVGFELTGKLREGVTATDLVLFVTAILRSEKVVGKFVEFFGPGAASIAVPDRATIGNMAPEYGATMGFFPVDEMTVAYFEGTGRTKERSSASRRTTRRRACSACPHRATSTTPRSSARPGHRVAEPGRPEAPAGPHRPGPPGHQVLGAVQQAQRRQRLQPAGRQAQAALPAGHRRPGRRQRSRAHRTAGAPRELVEMVANRSTKAAAHTSATAPAAPKGQVTIGNGDVLIAAITSCTNTSNPSVMLAAGLLAKKAVEAGLTVKPHVKTSLAPGSRIVTEYLEKAGLLPYLEKLGFYLAGYGCTTCIGNAGDLTPEINEAITKNDLVGAAVLSGNRNFEARIHPNLKANFLASPPLVVAFAIAGNVMTDLMTEPVGKGKHGKDVYLGDIWPTPKEIDDNLRYAMNAKSFRKNYEQGQDRSGQVLEQHQGHRRPGLRLAQVDLHRRAAVLRGLQDEAACDQRGLQGRAHHGAVRRLDHHRPHLAGRLHQGKLARGHLAEGARRAEGRLQQLRFAPRQPRRDDARHLRQRAHQEPHDSAGRQRHAGRGRPHAVPARQREDVHLRRRHEVHGRGHPDGGVRRRGIRHRLVARLGRQGHAAAWASRPWWRAASSASTAPTWSAWACCRCSSAAPIRGRRWA